jgi:predicted enzyme related to lactoylglutathione lyase
MHHNPVAWIEIHVADMQRAKVFDEAVFNHGVFQLYSIT